jgi:thiamine pyrophosphate-dependent acetolactate synthase large subunit-like protein
MGAGFEHASTVHEAWELEAALGAAARAGPSFIHARIRPGNSAVPNIPLGPAEIRERFMGAMGTREVNADRAEGCSTGTGL